MSDEYEDLTLSGFRGNAKARHVEAVHMQIVLAINVLFWFASSRPSSHPTNETLPVLFHKHNVDVGLRIQALQEGQQQQQGRSNY